MAVSMADIKKLRTMTGAGMMDCKNALAEAENDMDRAIELIRERGQAIAAKRSDREASEGCVLAGVKGGFGAIVAVKCETDFVAKNEEFVALAQTILDKALEAKPESLEALLALEMEGRTIEQMVTDRSGVTGEKMELGFYEFVNAGTAVGYIHPGNMLASLVAFEEEGVETSVARDVAMQVAAMSPVALNRDEVPADVREKELEIGREKARQEGKPEQILDRIAEGRLNKFFQESTLMEQAFIKDNKQSIAQYTKANGATPVAMRRVTLNEE